MFQLYGCKITKKIGDCGCKVEEFLAVGLFFVFLTFLTYHFSLFTSLGFALIEFEILLSVVVTDVFNHLSEQVHVIGYEALLHIVAEEVAE